MALTISRDEEQPKNLSVGIDDRVTLRMTTVEEVVSKWDVNLANTNISTVNRGVKFDSLLADSSGHLVKSSAQHVESQRRVEGADAMTVVAKNLGIPVGAIEVISFGMNNGRVDSFDVAFKQGASEEMIGQSNLNMAIAMEKAGIIPAGTTFQMGQKKAVQHGLPEFVLLDSSAGVEFAQLTFRGVINGTGQDVKLQATREGQVRIVAGKDHQMPHGSLYRNVEVSEHAAASKVAQALGAGLVGEAGISPFGADATTKKSMFDALTLLESAKIIGTGTTERLQKILEVENITAGPRSVSTPQIEAKGAHCV